MREHQRRRAALVLQVVEPAAVEAAAKLASEDATERDAANDALHLELKAARYAAERAERQYDAAEPENRLVVDELERRWNVALERTRALEARIDEVRPAAPSGPIDTARFASLPADLARVWHKPTTDVRLKKRIVRTLIETITVETTEREVSLAVYWKGGVHTELVVQRRRRGENRVHTPPETVETIRLLARVCPDELIARAMNASGIKTARDNLWTSTLVRSFRSSHHIPVYNADDETWLTLSGAAKLESVADLTLKRAIERGVLTALRPVARGPWILERRELLRADVLVRLTKKSRPRPGEPVAQASTQLRLKIPRT